MNWLLFAALLATPKLPHGQHPAPPEGGRPAVQLSAEDVKERVGAYLGSIDRPTTAAEWRALGPQAGSLLEPIATDPEEMPTRRAKALEGLVAVAPERAAQLVGKLARDEKEPVVVRVAALRGAGVVLSPSKALSELKPVLRSARSAGMRSTAAGVLAQHKGGCAAVREQVEREAEEHRAAYQAALSRCGE